MAIQKNEDRALEFWKKAKIFEKSVEKPASLSGLKKPKGNYVFYDGPPFITGLPHYGTILPSIMKDVIPRFWTMRGFRVERIWGWDCHGLPAENKVEDKLGLKNKKDIEKLGVGKFVDECKLYVKDVSDQWNWYIDKIARWVDMENSYKTMDLNFMESVIWAFKELYDKKLIYEGFRTSLHCPRCATPLSKFEVTMDAGSYQDITEQSVIVKFPVKNSKKFQDAEILAWTTTPWTLPGNLALAVSKKIKYALVEFQKKNYIVAKDLAEVIFKNEEYKIKKEFSGKELVGLEYEPLFKINSDEILKSGNIYKIYDAEFVTTEEGTGIVHIAPNFGEDDFEFGKKHKIPIIELMDENGIYKDLAGSEWSGEYFKDANKKAIKKLEENNKLFTKFNYTHSYPFCHRCKTQLIYKTQKAWYLDIDKIRDSMVKTNKKINWVPEYFKEGRFRYNIENAPHWCLSRSRYWGSPIPVWRCSQCEEIKVLGSISEIEKLSRKKVSDLHMPVIDEHEFPCLRKNCKGIMKRVPEVLDCWFESGAMPFAQWHYPFERKNDFNKIFPADFIVEYTGQLRGWFYYLHVLSNGLFKSESFKNVVVTGVLAGNDGRKMSKLYGNYPDPKLTLEKYGGDALRMYFLSSPVVIGGDMNISEKDISDSLRKNVMLLYNVHNFYKISKHEKTSFKKFRNSKNILDKWIISRCEELLEEVTENLEKYDLPSASRPITTFIEDLSTWYLRLSRERLNNQDKEALSTLEEILFKTSLIIAPFMPYISEYIWQDLTNNNYLNEEASIHLEAWPESNKKNINKKLTEEMKNVREIVSLGLKERDISGLGLKWPLSSAKISADIELKKYIEELIKQELNIRKIDFKKSKTTKVELDKNLTPELEEEGYARELSRKVQAFRKKLGLEKKHKIKLKIITDGNFVKILKNKEKFIKERTNSREVEITENVTTDKERFKNKVEFNIKDKKGEIVIDSFDSY